MAVYMEWIKRQSGMIVIVVLLVVTGWVYVSYKPTVPFLSPAINDVNGMFPTVATSTASKAQTPAVNTSLIVFSSPSSGDSFCLGDLIPVRWSAPKTAQSFSLKAVWQNGNSVITSIAGNTSQFSSPVYYDYEWNQKNSNGNAFFAGSYYIEAIAHLKDGSSITGRSATFSTKECPKAAL